MDKNREIWPLVVRFFDKLEDRVRGYLTRYRILYAFLGGVGVVLFWRGVWHTADVISLNIDPSISVWDGPVSILVGSIILLIVGLFVSIFIGDSIIMSGLKHEKKLAEKTEEEVREDEILTLELRRQIQQMQKDIDEIKESLKKKT